MNTVSSAVTRIQPAQPEKVDDQVYGLKSNVWPYGLLPAGNMSTRVQVYFVYNSPRWGIYQLTINELAPLWDIPLLLQEMLEEIDKKSLLVQFLSLVLGKKLLLASD